MFEIKDNVLVVNISIGDLCKIDDCCLIGVILNNFMIKRCFFFNFFRFLDFFLNNCVGYIIKDKL